ncbi:hypothetical protein DH2020_037693 [Rehmannia glutinosa]|uniref:Uncharacterized protein n=1 Tax=Rehmannia glutinosa TaxID=99300 RepID=A0ABR0V2N1_REHGL
MSSFQIHFQSIELALEDEGALEFSSFVALARWSGDVFDRVPLKQRLKLQFAIHHTSIDLDSSGYTIVVENLIKKLPIGPADWPNGTTNFTEKDFSKGVCFEELNILLKQSVTLPPKHQQMMKLVLRRSDINSAVLTLGLEPFDAFADNRFVDIKLIMTKFLIKKSNSPSCV